MPIAHTEVYRATLTKHNHCATEAMRKYLKDGKPYYSVADAAKLLGPNAAKVRELMGTGQLAWNQTRLNGRLIIDAESIVRYREQQKAKPARE